MIIDAGNENLGCEIEIPPGAAITLTDGSGTLVGDGTVRQSEPLSGGKPYDAGKAPGSCTSTAEMELDRPADRYIVEVSGEQIATFSAREVEMVGDTGHPPGEDWKWGRRELRQRA
jgi:hypothetical protein